MYSLGLGLDPRKIDGILVSHAHPDHYTDAEVLVEGMTAGTVKRRGVLAAARSVLKGGETAESAISKYHQSLPEKVVEVRSGTELQIKNMRIVGVEARHSDVDAVGFRLETDVGSVGYTSDTEFFESIERHYKGVRVMILCVLRPSGESWKGHITTDDAIKIVNLVRPEFAVLTHFGMKMILRGPAEEAEKVENETGVRTVAARDGMELLVDEEIVVYEFGEREGRTGLDMFLDK